MTYSHWSAGSPCRSCSRVNVTPEDEENYLLEYCDDYSNVLETIRLSQNMLDDRLARGVLRPMWPDCIMTAQGL